jgi:hypothetical protein
MKMINIDLVIDKIIQEVYTKSKDYLSLIINENARVENYFSVIILGKLDKLKKEKLISNFDFQYLVKENKRKHVDFLIELSDKFYLIELKHLAIDNHFKSENRRTLSFYTRTKNSGTKVGIIGDLDKLEKIENNISNKKILLAIITNPPSKDEVNKKLIELCKERKKWRFEYHVEKENKIGFIIAKMD